MSVLEYASKFMELSHFAAAFVADEKLKMNLFKAVLNPNLEERMSVSQYVCYKDLYDTAANMKRAMKENSIYFSEQRGNKRKGDQRENFYSQANTRGIVGASTTIAYMAPSKPTIYLE